jgi:hypothetical protein
MQSKSSDRRRGLAQTFAAAHEITQRFFAAHEPLRTLSALGADWRRTIELPSRVDAALVRRLSAWQSKRSERGARHV